MLDTFKAPLWSMPSSFEIVSSAKAARKIVVIGNLSDFRGSERSNYQKTARAALDVAEIVIFYGRNAERVRRLKPDFRERLFMFEEFEFLIAFLKDTVRQGDLVYLKASGVNHIERVMYEFERPVACRTSYCRKRLTCNKCDLLYGTEPLRTRRKTRAAR
jgi:UDP-N-acetylmuramoyl-tripeptide--D-alanyl-D-alanine ligase